MVHVPLGVSDKFRGKSKQGLYGDVMMEVDWSVGEIMKVLEKTVLTRIPWSFLQVTTDPGLISAIMPVLPED